MPLPRISVGVFIILIALFVYGTSLGVWIVTIQAGESSVIAVADQYRFEYSRSTAEQLTVHLSTAENITASNARAFRNGVYVIPDRPDPRGPEVDAFLVGFRSTLYGMMHVTTVSMTDYRGNLFGVYNNYNYTIAGMWQQYADPATGEPVLLDFQTYPKDSPKEGQIMQSIGVTVPYNSSEQVWYTVCNTSIPDDDAWTPMYFMGNVGTVTSMVSQSHVAHRADGSLIGVMSIDMATGFVGATLGTIVDKNVFSFAVDANAVALLGTSTGDSIMACTIPGVADNACPVENQIFLDPSNSTNALVRDATREILRRSGGGTWLNAGALDFTFGSKMVNTIRVSRRKLDWIVVVIIDRDAFLGDVQRTTTNMIIIEVVAGVAQILLCIAFAVAIRQPLMRLIQQMEPLQRLDTNVDVDEEPSIIAEVAHLQRGHRALHFALERIKSFVPAAVYHELRRNGRSDSESENEDDDADLDEAITPAANRTPSEGRSTRIHVRERRPSDNRSTQSTSTAATAKTVSVMGHNGINVLSTKATPKLVTILAVNGVGFHAAVEAMSLDAFADQMTRLVATVNRVTKYFNGVLDFFQGDHFVVSFNAVKRVELHMRRALQAAVELTDAASRRSDAPAVALRCGVSSSRCVVGNLGTADVKRFTIAGKAYTDAVLLAQMCSHYEGVFALTTQRCLDDSKGVVSGQLVDVVPLPGRPRVVIGCPRQTHASERMVNSTNGNRSRNNSVGRDGGGGGADGEWMYTMGSGDDEYSAHNERFEAFLRGSNSDSQPVSATPMQQTVTLPEVKPTPEKLLQSLIEHCVDGTKYVRRSNGEFEA